MVKGGFRLTEKRMTNKIFRKTEEAILEDFTKQNEPCSTRKMARRIGIARVTFYVHHRTVRQIVPDCEKYLMKKYKKLMEEKTIKEKGLNEIFCSMLIFIYRNKKMFAMLMKKSSRGIIDMMLDELKGRIEQTCYLKTDDSKVFMVYRGEVKEIIADWSKRDFANDEIEKVLRDIVFLTKTMKARLQQLDF